MQVYVGLSGTSQSEVSFTYLTEAGEQKDPYQIVKFGEEDENRNRYLSVYRLTPNMVRTKCFGMIIDGNGSFAVAGWLSNINRWEEHDNGHDLRCRLRQYPDQN